MTQRYFFSFHSGGKHLGPFSISAWTRSEALQSFLIDCGFLPWIKDWLNSLRLREKMAAISQAISSNAFSWMKIYEFRLWIHRSLSLRFELTIFQHCFRKWLGAGQATSHYLNQWWLVHRRIYASLGLNELTAEKQVFHWQTKICATKSLCMI